MTGWPTSQSTNPFFSFLPQCSSLTWTPWGFTEQDPAWDTHQQQKISSVEIIWLALRVCRDAAVFPDADLMKRPRCLLAFLKGLPNGHFSKWLLRDGCSYHDSSTSMFNTWLKTLWDENVLLLSTNWNWTRFFLKTNKQSKTVLLVCYYYSPHYYYHQYALSELQGTSFVSPKALWINLLFLFAIFNCIF